MGNGRAGPQGTGHDRTDDNVDDFHDRTCRGTRGAGTGDSQHRCWREPGAVDRDRTAAVHHGRTNPHDNHCTAHHVEHPRNAHHDGAVEYLNNAERPTEPSTPTTTRRPPEIVIPLPGF